MLQFLGSQRPGPDLPEQQLRCGYKSFHPFLSFLLMHQTFRELVGTPQWAGTGSALETCGHLSVSSDVPSGPRPGGITGPVPASPWAPLYSDGGLFSENMISPNELLPHSNLRRSVSDCPFPVLPSRSKKVSLNTARVPCCHGLG